MNILETYLNYLEELSRWKKEVPNLSNQSIQKLKDTKVAKTSDEFRKGVNTGTKNITKKSNAIFNKGIPIGQSGKHHNRPSILHKGKTIVNSPYSLKGGSDAKSMGIETKKDWLKNKPYIDRHEADEARYANKIRKKTGSMKASTIVTKNGMPVGHHNSLGVLKKEKELTDFANKMYGDAKELRNVRKLTGEYNIVDKMTYKDINKMDVKKAKGLISKLRSDILRNTPNKKIAIKLLKKIKTARKIGLSMTKYGKPAAVIGAVGVGVGAMAGYKKMSKKDKK